MSSMYIKWIYNKQIRFIVLFSINNDSITDSCKNECCWLYSSKKFRKRSFWILPLVTLWPRSNRTFLVKIDFIYERSFSFQADFSVAAISIFYENDTQQNKKQIKYTLPSKRLDIFGEWRHRMNSQNCNIRYWTHLSVSDRNGISWMHKNIWTSFSGRHSNFLKYSPWPSPWIFQN